MEDFLNDPYEHTQKTANSAATRWRPENGSFSNLDDLQFTVAPESSVAHDLRSTYASYNESSAQNQGQAVSRDPFLETFDFLGSPTQQVTSPNLAAGGSDAWADAPGGDNLYGDSTGLNSGMDPLNNLDSLILPDNSNININNMTQGQAGAGNNGLNMFSSSQYFSPGSRGANFGQLNSIVEDSVSPSFYSNTFSPTHSRHGSVSIPPPSNSYLSQHLLSPRQNTYDGSLDTLKSPYSGSYLGSPPAMSLAQGTGMNLSSSYSSSQANVHSPNNQNYGMGPSSVGALTNTHLRKSSEQPPAPKQLTSEEKAKRRREFHNAVERRRRDLIKEKIKVLGFLVPPSLLTPQVCAVQAFSKQPNSNSKEIKEMISAVRIKDTKPNKAFILQTSVDYIRHLQYVLEKQSTRREELESSISKLRVTSSPNELKTEPAGEEPKNGDIFPSEFDPDEFFSAEV